jgi:hypothetical protein
MDNGEKWGYLSTALWITFERYIPYQSRNVAFLGRVIHFSTALIIITKYKYIFMYRPTSKI